MSTSDSPSKPEVADKETAAADKVDTFTQIHTKSIFPTTRVETDDPTPSVFLAGSIDMGEAVNWQAAITKSLESLKLGIYIFNPRRVNWNSGWPQDINFKPFFDQVDWELDMLERATVIAMFLPENSKAPISLLELGLFAHKGTLIVGCPKAFWRRGNVEIVCKRYNVPMVDTLEELVTAVHDRLAALGKANKNATAHGKGAPINDGTNKKPESE
ncbi:hypothetical protein BDN70DRAFT_874899 [Pholiota conissans]|uniref:Nucleoside 2-deoxyribosyltransferase like protein n=1 Tax=Pholiota conissans TaxID=109636 RepID=A0A9P5Z8G2_9AGAR|nr:hypothetical protein BDN70DRAFT_874899 [Pholiota conissans]